MLDKMLVNVLSSGIPFVALARSCCCQGGDAAEEVDVLPREWLQRRIRTVAPRVILVMGASAGTALGLVRGRALAASSASDVYVLLPSSLVLLLGSSLRGMLML